MAGRPQPQPRNFRDGADVAVVRALDAPVFDGLAHLVRAVVGHSVRAVVDLQCSGVKPAVAFNQADAVGRAPPYPVFAYEVLVVAHASGVLVQLVLEQRRREDVAERPPDVAPAVFVGVNGVGDKVAVVLDGRIDKAGNVQPDAYAVPVFDFAGSVAAVAVRRTVALVARRVVGVVFGVFLQRVAVPERLEKRPRPRFGLVVELQPFHPDIRVDFVNHNREDGLPSGEQRPSVGELVGAEFADSVNGDFVQILAVRHGIEGDKP